MTFILDTSAILAAILGEPGGESVTDNLGGSAVSTVIVAEVYTFASRNAHPLEPYTAFFDSQKIEIVPLTSATAIAAGKMVTLTRSAGLSLGDRCCLALAQERQAAVLTADRPWGQFAEVLGIDIQVIR